MYLKLVVSGGKTAVAVFVGSEGECRNQKPNGGKYQEELKAIAEMIEGTPQVETL